MADGATDKLSFEELVAADPTLLEDPVRMSQMFQENPAYRENLGVDTPLNQDETPPTEGDADATSTAAAAPAAAPPAAAPPAAPAPEAPAGIATKDGKHVIPYNVLEQARSGKANAEAAAARLAEENKRLQEQLAATGKTGAASADATTGQATLLTEEELAALEEEAPQLARGYRAQQALIKQLQESIEEVKPAVARVEQDKTAEIQRLVDETIDGIPQLANWRSNSPALFQRAIQFDSQLMNDPKWADKTLEERFAEATRLTDAEAKAGGYTAAPAPAPADPAAVARAKLKAAQEAPNRPSTLSDLPAGTPPGTDPDENLNNVDVVTLGNKLAQMTPEQQDAWLAKYVR